MPFTSEQDRFIVMAHFRSGTLNPGGNWSYLLQYCIEQFMQQYPDEMIEYDIFKQHKYRHLIEFRTRKAHRWVVKDTDLLKYLLIMFMSVFAYMAAYTAISVNFVQENYSLLAKTETMEGVHYQSCKPLWWDYVTQVGELSILIFGIHLSFASRNARTQFHLTERFVSKSVWCRMGGYDFLKSYSQNADSNTRTYSEAVA
ncbi:hypothetical protein FQA39_LY13725 [Lamprigera yunnana]|nr:hypothetical protein FQA39_LY13725 [Lamprigera yunnana]